MNNLKWESTKEDKSINEGLTLENIPAQVINIKTLKEVEIDPELMYIISVDDDKIKLKSKITSNAYYGLITTYNNKGIDINGEDDFLTNIWNIEDNLDIADINELEEDNYMNVKEIFIKEYTDELIILKVKENDVDLTLNKLKTYGELKDTKILLAVV